MFNYYKNCSGFTLLEMIISVGIFSTLVVSAIGITLGVSNAQIKAANIQAIQDNIRFGLELITKEMRTGRSYALTNFCSPTPGKEISFTTSLGDPRIYYLDTNTQKIMRVVNSDCNDVAKISPLTADEVTVDGLTFQLNGQNLGPLDGQPIVTISLKISSKSSRFGPETNMNLQTTVVQRLRDL